MSDADPRVSQIAEQLSEVALSAVRAFVTGCGVRYIARDKENSINKAIVAWLEKFDTKFAANTTTLRAIGTADARTLLTALPCVPLDTKERLMFIRSKLLEPRKELRERRTASEPAPAEQAAGDEPTVIDGLERSQRAELERLRLRVTRQRRVIARYRRAGSAPRGRARSVQRRTPRAGLRKSSGRTLSLANVRRAGDDGVEEDEDAQGMGDDGLWPPSPAPRRGVGARVGRSDNGRSLHPSQGPRAASARSIPSWTCPSYLAPRPVGDEAEHGRGRSTRTEASDRGTPHAISLALAEAAHEFEEAKTALREFVNAGGPPGAHATYQPLDTRAIARQRSHVLTGAVFAYRALAEMARDICQRSNVVTVVTGLIAALRCEPHSAEKDAVVQVLTEMPGKQLDPNFGRLLAEALVRYSVAEAAAAAVVKGFDKQMAKAAEGHVWHVCAVHSVDYISPALAWAIMRSRMNLGKALGDAGGGSKAKASRKKRSKPETGETSSEEDADGDHPHRRSKRPAKKARAPVAPAFQGAAGKGDCPELAALMERMRMQNTDAGDWSVFWKFFRTGGNSDYRVTPEGRLAVEAKFIVPKSFAQVKGFLKTVNNRTTRAAGAQQRAGRAAPPPSAAPATAAPATQGGDGATGN